MYEYSKAQFYSLVYCILLEFREILAQADWNRRDIQRKTGKTFLESKTDSKLINLDYSLLKVDYTLLESTVNKYKRTHGQGKIFMYSWIIIHMILSHVNIIETWMSKTHFNKKREH